MRSLPPRGAVRRAGRGSRPRSRRWRPEGERRMGANPHANGGLLLRDLALPDFRDYAVDGRRPGDDEQRGHARARRLGCATSCAPTRDDVPRLRARTRPRRTGSARVFEATDRAWMAERRAGDDHLAPGRPRHGGARRAPVPGLAGGLPAHRPPWPVQLLRGVHPHRGLDVQPARQVAEGHARHPVAAADRVAELPALLARLAPGPQRLLPPGPGLHRPRGQQEGRDRPRLPAAGRQHACCRSWTTACAAATTSTSSWPASSPRWTGCRWTTRSLHCTRGIGIWDWASSDAGGEPDVVLACAGDIPTLEALAAAALLREHLPELKVRVVNVVDLMRLQAAERAPARPAPTASSTRCSPPTGR